MDFLPYKHLSLCCLWRKANNQLRSLAHSVIQVGETSGDHLQTSAQSRDSYEVKTTWKKKNHRVSTAFPKWWLLYLLTLSQTSPIPVVSWQGTPASYKGWAQHTVHTPPALALVDQHPDVAARFLTRVLAAAVPFLPDINSISLLSFPPYMGSYTSISIYI